MGDGKNTVEAEECDYHVLSTIIDFMYGIALPEDLGLDDLCSLLAMSDLYLMTGLKDAVALLLGKHLKVNNFLQISTMAEKHSAVKLQEQCCSFILDNIDSMSKECLDNLAMALPMVGQVSLHRHRVQAFANKVFASGPHTLSFFKKITEFSSDEEYRNYVRGNIKPGVIVQYIGHSIDIPYGTLGDVIDLPFGRERVRWQNGFYSVFPDRNVDDFLWLELIADVVR